MFSRLTRLAPILVVRVPVGFALNDSGAGIQYGDTLPQRLHQRGAAGIPQVGFDYPLRYGTVGADISRNSRDRAFGRTVNLALSVMSGDCPCILRALPPHAVSAAVGADPDRVICHGGRGWLTATDFQFLPAMNALSHWSAPSSESRCTAVVAPSSRSGCRNGFGRRNPNIRPYARTYCRAATCQPSSISTSTESGPAAARS